MAVLKLGSALGGGISDFSGLRGLACDTVINYEAVLANGSIIDANATTHCNLWRALKGGGSNLGIVTRFDVSTIDVANISYYEKRVMDSKFSRDFVNAIVDFTNASTRHRRMLLFPFQLMHPAMDLQAK